MLFADLVGFTTLAEGRDAETVRDLLSRYFDGASEIIGRYGGTVEKFIGDAVMAVWGAPTAHEDDAERAVRAALDMVAAVRALSDGSTGTLQARAGVLTGEAAVTLGATNQGLVAGDLVNTASRLQTAAAPGTVLVGESTRRSAAGAIAFEPAGDLELKGKAEPLTAYRALRIVAKARGIGRTEGLEPPFVGRDVEFRLVRDAFHAVRPRTPRPTRVDHRRGRRRQEPPRLGVLQVHGRPGQRDVLARGSLAGLRRGRVVLGARRDGPQALRPARGGRRGDDPGARHGGVEQHVTDPAERPDIEACLLALLGHAEPPAGGRDALFAGWRRFFERLAEQDPVSLLFEDIQWADDGLLDFIESLLEWSQSYPIFVLTLSRPELLDRRPTWGAGRNATSLPLGPLADDAMRDLLAGLVPDLPEAATRTILERAGGMPLYAVETVRMLVADGASNRSATAPTGRPGPSTRSTCRPRSRRSSRPGWTRWRRPSGRCSRTPPCSVRPSPSRRSPPSPSDEPASLEPRLRGLVTRDLLALDTDPRSPERGQYGFVQALIREVAYGTLSRKDRRTRHLAAARYFESLDEHELAGALGDALPRRLPGRRGRSRGGGAGRPGPHRPARRRRSRQGPRLARPGHRVPRVGGATARRGGRSAGPPRGGGRRGHRLEPAGPGGRPVHGDPGAGAGRR